MVDTMNFTSTKHLVTIIFFSHDSRDRVLCTHTETHTVVGVVRYTHNVHALKPVNCSGQIFSICLN